MATPEEKAYLEAVQQNDIDAVRRFIEEKDVRPSVSNFMQQTGAHLAVENGNLEMLKYLIGKDRELVSAIDEKNRTVLHQAVRKGFIEIIKYLIEDLGLDILALENRFFGDTAVHTAAEEDQLDVLKYFLENKKIDVNVKDEIGASPLFLAAEKVRMRIIKYLIEDMNANVTMIDFQRDNVLYRSATIGDLTVPKYLLDERNIKFDVNWKDNFGRTILHNAARHNHVDFIRYFVEQKHANFDISNELGWTPMHEAASEGHIDVIKYMVQKGANTDCKNNHGKTPANISKDQQIIEYLNEAPKSRSRRSTFLSEPKKYHFPRMAFGLPQTGIISHNSMPRMIANSSSIVGLESETRERRFEANASYLQGFLVIANVIARNPKNSAYPKIDLRSPKEITENKIDPLAIKAIKIDRRYVSR